MSLVDPALAPVSFLAEAGLILGRRFAINK